jgi:hypothetical protein
MSVLRPETPMDRLQQQALVERVAQAFGFRVLHMPRFAPFDAYLLSDDREHVVGVIEVKRRTVPHDRYPTCPIEVGKVAHLGLAAAPFDHPKHWVRLLGVAWSDGVVGYAHGSEVEWCRQSRMTLRNPRDENDVGDLCYDVPLARFTLLPPLRARLIPPAGDTATP